jgi:hypothetical protein
MISKHRAMERCVMDIGTASWVNENRVAGFATGWNRGCGPISRPGECSTGTSRDRAPDVGATLPLTLERSNTANTVGRQPSFRGRMEQ